MGGPIWWNTPITDVVRGRLSGRLDLEGAIADAGLEGPLADLVRLLQQNDSCSASVTELRELELLAAEAPRGWYAHAETHRGISARVDNRQNFAQVVAALRALKALSPNANGAR